MNVIINVAFHPGKRRLEKSFRAESVRGETLFGLSVGNNAHFFCVRTKDAHDEIVADAMRTENPEWIGMRAGEEDVEFVDGHAGYFEGAHALAINLKASAQNVARRFRGGCIGSARPENSGERTRPRVLA